MTIVPSLEGNFAIMMWEKRAAGRARTRETIQMIHKVIIKRLDLCSPVYDGTARTIAAYQS